MTWLSRQNETFVRNRCFKLKVLNFGSDAVMEGEKSMLGSKTSSTFADKHVTGVKDCVHLKPYVDLLESQCSAVDVQNLTMPSEYALANYQQGPISDFSWTKNATLKLHFVTEMGSSLLGMKCDGEEIYAASKTWGILGMCHYPSLRKQNLRQVHQTFMRTMRLVPGIAVKKLFVFEFPFDQDMESYDDCDDLVMFPSAKEIDRNSTTISLHMEVVMNNVAVSLIMAVHRGVQEAHEKKTSIFPKLNAPQSTHPLYEVESDVDFITSLSDSKLKKRRSGRMLKYTGDYCLMLSSPKNALSHYESSLEVLKSCHDHLWYAGCLEGYVTALYLQKNKEVYIPEVIEKSLEAIHWYSKQGGYRLELHLLMDLANYCACVKPQPMAAMQCIDLMTQAQQLSPQLTMEERKHLVYQCAIFSERMGMMRKFAFFVHELALLSYHEGDVNQAFLMDVLVTRVFQISKDGWPDQQVNSQQNKQPFQHSVWMILGFNVVKHLFVYSYNMGNTSMIAFYALQLLRISSALVAGMGISSPNAMTQTAFASDCTLHDPNSFTSSAEIEFDLDVQLSFMMDNIAAAAAEGGGGGGDRRRSHSTAMEDFRIGGTNPFSSNAFRKRTLSGMSSSIGGSAKSLFHTPKFKQTLAFPSPSSELFNGEHGMAASPQGDVADAHPPCTMDLSYLVKWQISLIQYLQRCEAKVKSTSTPWLSIHMKGLPKIAINQQRQAQGQQHDVIVPNPFLKQGNSNSNSNNGMSMNLDVSPLANKDFFYSPFDAKSDEKREHLLTGFPTWIQNEITHVVVGISNPLSVPLLVQSIRLVLHEKVVAECPEETFTLPADVKDYSVVLTCRILECPDPNDAPKPILQGVCLRTLNITYLHDFSFISEAGCNRVLSSLPRLTWKGDAAAAAAMSLSSLRLFEGERKAFCFHLDNMGDLPIGFVSITLAYDDCVLDANHSRGKKELCIFQSSMQKAFEESCLIPQQVVSLDWMTWQKQNGQGGPVFPLRPRATLSIPLILSGDSSVANVRLQVLYGEDSVSSTHFRKFGVPLKFCVQPALAIVSTRVVNVPLPSPLQLALNDEHSDDSFQACQMTDSTQCFLVVAIMNASHLSFSLHHRVVQQHIENESPKECSMKPALNACFKDESCTLNDPLFPSNQSISIQPNAIHRILLPLQRVHKHEIEWSKDLTRSQQLVQYLNKCIALPWQSSLGHIGKVAWKSLLFDDQSALHFYRPALTFDVAVVNTFPSQVEHDMKNENETNEPHEKLANNMTIHLDADSDSNDSSSISYATTFQEKAIFKAGLKSSSCMQSQSIFPSRTIEEISATMEKQGTKSFRMTSNESVEKFGGMNLWTLRASYDDDSWKKSRAMWKGTTLLTFVTISTLMQFDPKRIFQPDRIVSKPLQLGMMFHRDGVLLPPSELQNYMLLSGRLNHTFLLSDIPTDSLEWKENILKICFLLPGVYCLSMYCDFEWATANKQNVVMRTWHAKPLFFHATTAMPSPTSNDSFPSTLAT